MPCLNDASCRSLDGINYKCACKSRYTGFKCEHVIYEYTVNTSSAAGNGGPCFSEPCFNGGKCHELNENLSVNKLFQCECMQGFHGVYCEADLRSSIAHGLINTQPLRKKCKIIRRNKCIHCACFYIVKILNFYRFITFLQKKMI